MEQEMYVARDLSNDLYLYIGDAPVKDNKEIWTVNLNANCCELNPNLFPEVKWTDEKPTKVRLKKLSK